MDYDKLIRRLRNDADAYRNGKTLGRAFADQEDVLDNAATAIETLRVDLARVTAERDAAVKGGHNIDTCHFCTNGQCYGRGGTQVCEPKWRGIKKED